MHSSRQKQPTLVTMSETLEVESQWYMSTIQWGKISKCSRYLLHFSRVGCEL